MNQSTEIVMQQIILNKYIKDPEWEHHLKTQET